MILKGKATITTDKEYQDAPRRSPPVTNSLTLSHRRRSPREGKERVRPSLTHSFSPFATLSSNRNSLPKFSCDFVALVHRKIECTCDRFSSELMLDVIFLMDGKDCRTIRGIFPYFNITVTFDSNF